MRIHPLSNGKAYGWSKIRSLFDFFFPYAKNEKFEFIRAESSSTSTGQHEFYTFRAFYTHYLYELVISPAREWVNFIAYPFVNPIPQVNIGLAIAHDADGTTFTATASPYTWSHTCTGSNMLLVVGVGVTDSTGPTTTAITYNSVSMTKATASATFGTLGTNKGETSVWLLKAPTTGANTISVTFTNSASAVKGTGVSVSYSGAQQSSTADAVNSSTGSTTGAKTLSVTVVASNCWIYAIGSELVQTLADISPTQTSRGVGNTGSAGVQMSTGGEDTNATVSVGANSVGFTMNGTIDRGWGMSAASFAPGSSTANFFHFFPLGR